MIRSLHSRILQELLLAHRQELINAIISGGVDYPMYRQCVGQIQGVDTALKLSEDADISITGGEQGAA